MKTNLSPYLNFNGNCREAMEFYHSVLGGKLEMQTFGEAMPEGTPPELKDNIMHAMLENDAITFMASDGQPEQKVVMGDSISLCLFGNNEATLTEYFTKLSVGGQITMKMEKQFWGDIFGMFTDKFGIHRMVDIGEPRK